MSDINWIDKKEYPFKSNFLQLDMGSQLCPVIDDFLSS